MSDLRKHIAYLEGLAEGLRLDPESDQGKMFHGVIEALRALSQDLASIASRQEYLEEYASDLDDRVCALEACALPADADEAADDEELELVCPSCGYVFPVDDQVEDDEELDLVCPECGESVAAGDGDARVRAGDAGGIPPADR